MWRRGFLTKPFLVDRRLGFAEFQAEWIQKRSSFDSAVKDADDRRLRQTGRER